LCIKKLFLMYFYFFVGFRNGPEGKYYRVGHLKHIPNVIFLLIQDVQENDFNVFF
jgi:hypothetical protein